MNAIILSALTILSTSWAVEVRVYGRRTYKLETGTKKAVTVSPLPWSFNYKRKFNFFEINIVTKDPSKSMTWNLTCTAGQNVLFLKYNKAQDTYICRESPNSTEIRISLDLYKSDVHCASLLLAEESPDWRGYRNNKKTYEQICIIFCTVEVDVSHVCDDPPLTTTSEKTIEVTTVERNRAINNLTGYVPTTLRDILVTTTSNITTNDTNANHTDNSDIVVIVPSVLGVLFVVVVVVIVLWKCRLFKRRPTVNPRLPAIPPHQPFYVNLLMRDQCAREIAEIEGHEYEEIDERRGEGRPVEVIEDCQNGPTENHYDLPD